MSDNNSLSPDDARQIDEHIRHDLMQRIQSEGHDMPVKDVEGDNVGTVDHLDGDQLKLAKSGSPDGKHHYVPLDAVESMDANAVYLNVPGTEVE